VTLPDSSETLIQIVDAALAEATRKSGDRLACGPGCTECCMEPFPISQLDAWRLRQGLARLAEQDAARAERVRRRVRDSALRLAPDFPGDASTGVLEEGGGAEERFEDFANDEMCPVLDPESGLCDLYASRPLACRTFGQPVRVGAAVGVCDLCFLEASEEEIAACAAEIDVDELEAPLLRELEEGGGAGGRTIVTFALAVSAATPAGVR
jgi:Fe-S-cluster containining protein